MDPETTINHIFLWFYSFVNIGSVYQIASVYIEKYRGFWLAFLAPGVIYFVLPALLAACKPIHLFLLLLFQSLFQAAYRRKTMTLPRLEAKVH